MNLKEVFGVMDPSFCRLMAFKFFALGLTSSGWNIICLQENRRQPVNTSRNRYIQCFTTDKQLAYHLAIERNYGPNGAKFATWRDIELGF
jgi:hypothetical protein